MIRLASIFPHTGGVDNRWFFSPVINKLISITIAIPLNEGFPFSRLVSVSCITPVQIPPFPQWRTGVSLSAAPGFCTEADPDGWSCVKETDRWVLVTPLCHQALCNGFSIHYNSHNSCQCNLFPWPTTSWNSRAVSNSYSDDGSKKSEQSPIEVPSSNTFLQDQIHLIVNRFY